MHDSSSLRKNLSLSQADVAKSADDYADDVDSYRNLAVSRLVKRARDDEDDLDAYRNLAVSRLVKRAMAEVMRLPAKTLRNDSKAPQLSALWKTRVG